MAITNISTITPAMTFQQWWTTTNTIIGSLSNVVTMGASQGNTGDIITTGKLQAGASGVTTNSITPVAADDSLSLAFNTVKFNQKQIIYTPASGLSNTIQFVKGNDESVAANNTWSIGPVDGANNAQHKHLEITGINMQTGDPDAIFEFRRSDGDTKGLISGTNVEIDDAILPASITSNAASATQFLTTATVTFSGDVSGTFDVGDGSAAISCATTVDFSSAAAIKTITAGAGMAIAPTAKAGEIENGTYDIETGSFTPTDNAGVIQHGNTSDVVSTANTGLEAITNLTFDDFGHVTATESRNLANDFIKSNAVGSAQRSILDGQGFLVDTGTKISWRNPEDSALEDEAYIFAEEIDSTDSAAVPSGQTRSQLVIHNSMDYTKIRAGSNIIFQFDAGDSNNPTFDNAYTRFNFNVQNGNFIAAGDVTAFGTASDKALKENIEPITDALNKVNSINGYTFNYIDSPEKGRVPGVIAQELEQVLPEAIYETDEGTKAVRYQNTIALLVEAIKELKQQVDELKGK